MCHDKLATAPQAHTIKCTKRQMDTYIHICTYACIQMYVTRTIAPLSPITGSQTKMKSNIYAYAQANISARIFDKTLSLAQV